ncbi:polyribonucleotide nucleotidyltransferase [Chitinophaga qingshengii]|uniref:Polyribonucleotide nucleotidyltransferase n=1 Tax=Chitinophaga qingshengii TaxID=1569794 RepID=A0ABR7TSJ3_9BACT|nr:polyribonucleotide nucleotidyltransferase [Chitinophaga qingshengii]MBC9932441.1 polyribonucleotide nucleotidyltransferase [Chitinophaga qingshengii]
MNLTPISVKFDIGDGRIVTIETGKLARQADGAVTVRLGNAILLATVVANKEPKPGQSFFPLTVDYQEKFASAGRIPGSFFKREGRLSDYEVLISRLIDRALRPLFPDNYLCEVQVLVSLISSDPEVMPDALACLAASAALAVSDVPIQEIISEVRVARIEGKYVINPNRSDLAKADMDFIIGATEKNIMMVEGESKECQEEDLIAAIEAAHAAIKVQVKAQEELRDLKGVKGKREYAQPHQNEELKAKVIAFAKDKIYTVAKSASAKHDRSDAFKKIAEELKEHLGELPEEDAPLVGEYFHDLEKEVIRNMILDESVRLDGRSLDQVRPLAMETDLLPSPHGSALFTRGETQSLTTVTLGTPEDELLIESAATSNYVKFILHYNFPPFSTGEVKMMRGPGRREVGHGNLAMRSLKQMMPGSEYPYTVRVVSDILESNGSSSMATVCAGSLALMDAGVPLPKHVSGVAMGLISRASDGKWAVLTDILGDEDHLGDMDFKVTGTRDGIVGIQMDIKVDGLSMDVMRSALEQAKKGRLHIVEAMYAAVPAARPEPKPHAPRMEKIIIDREFIGAVIGPGGKIIQEIQRETGTTINIEEVGETGEVSIFSAQKDGLDRAVAWVKGIVAVPEVGEVYESVVKSIMPYGAFVEFMPGKQGLLHISEVSWKRLETMEGVLTEGEKVKVKLTGTDPKTGKFKLSRKVLMPKPEGYVERPEREEGDRRDRGDRGDRGDRRDRGPRDDRRGGGGDRDRRDRGGDRDRGPRPERQDRPEKPQEPTFDEE